MKTLIDVVRLTRPENLVIVILTMFLMRYGVIGASLKESYVGVGFQLSTGYFLLSVAVVVLVTAAGNIINDYFDQKVDKINKPEKVIVGKTVKRRVAMALHHTLNLVAVLLCAVVCNHADFWWPLLVPIGAATALWWYSPILKKLPVIGNAVVAALVASVPLWAGWFEIHLLRLHSVDLMIDGEHFLIVLERVLWAYSVMAFLLTLSREAIKDMQDVEGDRAGGYRTLAILAGGSVTRYYAATLQMSVLALTAWAIHTSIDTIGWQLPYLLVMASVAVPNFATVFFTLSARDKRGYQNASSSLKVAMLAGVLTALIFFTTAGQLVIASM